MIKIFLLILGVKYFINLMNNIFIIAPFINFPSESGFNRFIYLAEKLSKNNQVTLVTSNFSHVKKEFRNYKLLSKDTIDYNLVLIKENGYKKNFGFQRLLSILICEINLIYWIYKNRALLKGSIVYTGYPLMLYNVFLSLFISKYVKKIFIDVQDIWPHSISSVFNKNYCIDLFLSFVKRVVFRSFKSITGFIVVSETYKYYFNKLVSNVPVEVVYIGGDFSFIDSIDVDVDFKKLSLDRFDFNYFYIGTLSYSYDLKTALKVFQKFKEQNINLALHIFGDGPELDILETTSSDNVFFYGNLPYKEMISKVKSMDVALNLISNGAPQSVTNKLSDYMLLNKPIISSFGNKEVEELVIFNNGYLYESGNVDSLYETIIQNVGNVRNSEISIMIRTKFDRNISYRVIYDLITN